MLRSFRALVALSLLSVLLAAPAAKAAPGDLDPSFGNGGTVRLLTSEEKIAIRAVAVQPDLKIVIAGAEAPGNTIVLRLLPNGDLDPSFGNGGKVTTTVPTGFSEARAVTIQADGKIVVAGAAKGAVNADFFFARYNVDGSPDPSFGGGDGMELVPVGVEDDEARAVTVGSDGRIVATGSAEVPGNEMLAVVVLGPGGTPDPSFGGDGSVMKETAGKDDTGVAVALLGDGGFLVGDNSAPGAGDGFVLMKLLSNGEFDPGFGGGDGIVITPIPGSAAAEGRLEDFVLRPDGRIVAAGYGYEEVGMPPTIKSRFAAVGYLTGGELDPSFGAGGIFTHQAGLESAADVIELTPKGKLLLAGSYEAEPSNQSIALFRLDPLGALDPSFGSGGQVLRGVTAPFGEIFQDAALDAEERLVTVSTAYTGGGITTVVVSRFLGDPRPPQPAPPMVNQPAHARMKAIPRKVAARKLKRFSGTASDPDGNGLRRVQISLVRIVRARGKAKSSSRALRCFALKSAKGKFKRVKAKGKQCPQRWLGVKGKEKWSFRLEGALPPGRYVVFARAIDGLGLAESKFSRKLRNRYAFRVLASG